MHRRALRSQSSDTRVEKQRRMMILVERAAPGQAVALMLRRADVRDNDVFGQVESGLDLGHQVGRRC